MKWVKDDKGKPQLVAARPSTCHPWRNAVKDGRCRNCLAVTMPPLDMLPARVAGAEQRGGPVVPERCPKCDATWDATGDYVSCWRCGFNWHRTSATVIRPPGERQSAVGALGAAARWRGLTARPARGG